SLCKGGDLVEGSNDAPVASLACSRGEHRHQPLQRHGRGPAGQSIVGHVDKAARLEMPIDELQDMAAVQRAHPCPYAVERNIVEAAEVAVRAAGQLLERSLLDMGVAEACRLGQTACARDMRRIEIKGPYPGLWIRGRDRQRRLADTTAEFTIP